MANVKVLLVEDDAALAELLDWHLREAGYQVTQTANGDEALEMAAGDPPDIVLLDWMVEGTSGIEVCRRLRRGTETANVPIIMLTARAADDDRVRGLDTGADDYLTKPFSPRELLARIAAIFRRVRPALAGKTLVSGEIELDTTRHRAKRNGRDLALGPTEFRLLRHFMEHPARVFSRERLLDAVWGMDKDIELRTVDVHIRRLRQAINSVTETDPIRTVRASGYSMDWPSAA